MAASFRPCPRRPGREKRGGSAASRIARPFSECRKTARSTATSSDGDWQNGDLNANNSHFREGDSVPFRIVFSGHNRLQNIGMAVSWCVKEHVKKAGSGRQCLRVWGQVVHHWQLSCYVGVEIIQRERCACQRPRAVREGGQRLVQGHDEHIQHADGQTGGFDPPRLAGVSRQ